jgi:hypothetical protein
MRWGRLGQGVVVLAAVQHLHQAVHRRVQAIQQPPVGMTASYCSISGVTLRQLRHILTCTVTWYHVMIMMVRFAVTLQHHVAWHCHSHTTADTTTWNTLHNLWLAHSALYWHLLLLYF